MQGHFRNAAEMAREQNTPVRLKGLWGNIYILPAENRAYSGVPDVRLHGLTAMRMPSSGVVIAPIGSAEVKSQIAELDSVAITSIDALMWKLALWTSRGRLPAGTDPKAPIFLKRWPNFTRFVETPRAKRIAALWGRQPCTLDETPEALGIRQAEVFAFYSAAIALRCAEIGHRQADTVISPIPVQPASERGLFKRILNRLFGQAVVAPKSSMSPSHHDTLRRGQGRFAGRIGWHGHNAPNSLVSS